jgi:hypothetical protein
MARRIPIGITDTAQLGELVDRELSRLETLGKQGFVSTSRPVDKSQSYFFVDKGILKFFNATTGVTGSVTVT